MKTSVIVFVILSLAGTAWSADLYVAQKDPAADDKNSGAENKPLKTIQAGVDMAKVGDTIYVKKGDYEDNGHHRQTGELYRPTM